MVGSFNDVTAYAEKHRVHNRIAAYMLALDRVAFAIRRRGLYALSHLRLINLLLRLHETMEVPE